jgi:hypothetical protein
LDDFESALAHTQTFFWDMLVEDNAFVLLWTVAGHVASLHVSWTQWRNLFSLEDFGRDGYAIAEGLGGRMGRKGSPSANVGQKGVCPRRRVRFSKRRMARETWNGLPSSQQWKEGTALVLMALPGLPGLSGSNGSTPLPQLRVSLSV